MGAAERPEQPAAQPGPEPSSQRAPEDTTTAMRRKEAQDLNAGLARDLQSRAASETAQPVPSPKHGSEEKDDKPTSLRNWSMPSLSCKSAVEHQRRPSTLSGMSMRSGMGSPRHTNILEEDPDMETLAVERGELAQRVTEHINSEEVIIATGLNLRDVAGTSPDTICNGKVFRSSQVFSHNEVADLHIASALDLREQPHACRKAMEHSVVTGVAVAPLELLPDRLKLHVHRSLPMACPLCSGTDVSRSGCPNLYHTSLQIFHVDLLPSRVKLQIFVDMPWRIRLRTIAAPLAGKSPQEVMTPAVADPSKLGYLKLYKMMLDMSMRQIAKALRVFAYPENFPVIVHCIHGKDRTGLIIALLLLTLGVPEEIVVLDYAKSEVELKGGRDKGAVKGHLDDWLVTDDVVASSAQTMEDTLRYLDSRYGGIRKYLRIIGITRTEVHEIRKNLLQPREGNPLSRDVLSTFSMGSDDGTVASAARAANASQQTPAARVASVAEQGASKCWRACC